MTPLLAVPLLPLLAALAAIALPGRWRAAAGPLSAMATGFSLVVLIALHGQTGIWQTSWFTSGARVLSVGLALNGLTWVVAMLVSAVAFAVTLYAIGYMADEPLRARFFSVLSLFIGGMLTLVLASSLILMFAAWEMVGFASYLLIGFHSREDAAAAAAAKAFLMTRIGDIGFLLAWLLVLVHLGSTDIDLLLTASADGRLSPHLATLLAFLFFGAAVGKSAQLPLSIWLPQAMVAPTPVSALLHSATMVAAGVFLLLRLYPVFVAAPAALIVIVWLGFLTAGVAALLATAEMDIKRILAWSTISQLGEMMIAIGLGVPLAAALHLVAHASFKSTLFMGAGIIDKFAGTRDLRRIGGLRHALPVTALCLLAGGLALAGIEPLLTETSHDAILAAALRAGPIQGTGILLLLFLAGGYIGRAGAAILAGELRAPHQRRDKVTRAMQAGLVLTAVASALISLLIVALPRILPFGDAPQSSWLVHFGALAAGATGVVLGMISVRRRGPVPLLGDFPLTITPVLIAVAHLPVRAAFAIARAVDRIEYGIDRLTGMLSAATWRIARSPDTMAGAPGARISLVVIERWVDCVGLRMSEFTLAVARGSQRIEYAGFNAGGVLLARQLQRGGEQMRSLQTGKLYIYTLGLFVWTLLVVLVAAFALLS